MSYQEMDNCDRLRQMVMSLNKQTQDELPPPTPEIACGPGLPQTDEELMSEKANAYLGMIRTPSRKETARQIFKKRLETGNGDTALDPALLMLFNDENPCVSTLYWHELKNYLENNPGELTPEAEQMLKIMVAVDAANQGLPLMGHDLTNEEIEEVMKLKELFRIDPITDDPE